MSIYAIADTHLSFAADKPMDKFPGWQDYVLRLKTNWTRLVEPKDTVVIAGDISWGMTMEQALPDLRFLQELPGKKLIFKGNHDYWWNSMKKLETLKAENGLDSISFVHNTAVAAEGIAVCGTRGWMPEAGDDDKVLRREAGRLRMSLAAAGETGLEPVVFLHYPPIYESAVCEEIYSVLLEYGVKRCFFGHLHYERTGRFRRVERDGVVFSLISADFLGFTPLLVEK